MRTILMFGLMSISVAIASAEDKQSAAKPKAASSLDDELFKDLDDATTAPGVKSKPQAPAPATTPPKAEEKKSAPSPPPKLNPLDEELLKSLEGDDSQPPKKQPPKESSRPAGEAADDTDDPFLKLTRQIRDVEELIRRNESGEPTQERQQKIVDELAKLIEQVERQQQQKSSSSQSKQSRSQQQKPDSPQQQPSNKPGQGGKESKQARDSTEGTRDSRNEKPDPGRLKSLFEKAWGSLPERQRQDVMQSSVDDFPAKYQGVIEEYFKTMLRRQE